MNSLKKGFTLIELVISIALASMLSSVLFTILLQVQKTRQKIDNMVLISTQVMTFYERVFKDFSGMCWPEFVVPKNNPTKSNHDQKTATKDQISPKIAKIIYSENTKFNQLTNLKICSFITNNPLQTYHEISPKIVRVIYTLEPDLQAQSDRFILYRQQSSDLDYYQAISSATKYALIDNVRALSLIYFYEHDHELITYDELDLNTDLTQQSAQQQDHAKINLAQRVPNYIKLKISLWRDEQQSDYQEFEFWLNTYNRYIEPVKKEQDEKTK